MRRSGRTTRAVDQAVQKLFEDGELVIYTNPSDMYKNKVLDPDSFIFYQAQEYFARKLVQRLEIEHQNQFKINRSKGVLTIKLKNETEH